MNFKEEKGFTLLEVMLVVVILSILAAVALPRLSASSEAARERADIATGREIKAALDRYQIEHGFYPRLGDLKAEEGAISGSGFIPEYFHKLDRSVTQQAVPEEQKGFGIAALSSGTNLDPPQHVIMIYLTSDGSAAEVVVYDRTLSNVLWSSL
ncbi:MAG TPA: type II secretion system protein [Peptococcaceae bacterium]|nr:type II secretion system protein [Peptococcaceae bacterium]